MSKSRTSEYMIWASMKQRCYNKKSTNYPRYGGRGISVCKEWMDSFDNFIKDVGPRPSMDHSLDRINNNGNYEPSNCRWATRFQQARNTGVTINITFDGETKSLPEWAKIFGLTHSTLLTRLVRMPEPKIVTWRLFRQPDEPSWHRARKQRMSKEG
jgi:hypothetical protein